MYYNIVFSYALPMRTYLCNHGKCQNDIFCLLVTVLMCCRKCHSLSVHGVCYIIRYSQCPQSYKYIRFERPYSYFRLLVVVRIICGTFFELDMVENPRYAVGISTLTYRSSIDISTSGLGCHIATFGCKSSSKSYGDTFVELVMVEAMRSAVGISTLSIIVPDI